MSALVVSLSILGMQLTKTIHPPGGATALTAVISDPVILDDQWLFIATPVMLGTVILVVATIVFNNIARQYPLYWFWPKGEHTTKDAEEELEDRQAGRPIRHDRR